MINTHHSTNVRLWNQLQAPTAQEPLTEILEEEAGPGPDAELIGTEVVGVQEGDSSNVSGGTRAMGLTGLGPRLTLLWEWQCPLPSSATLCTRVTCMAWNKVPRHITWQLSVLLLLLLLLPSVTTV